MFSDPKLCFHHHVNSVSVFRAIKLFHLVRTLNFRFAPIYSLLLWFTLYVIYNTALLFGTTLSILDVYKLERVRSTFATVCNHHFSKLPYYTCAEALHPLKLHTLRDRRRRLDALFLLIFRLVLYVIVSFVIKLVKFDFLLGLSENFFCWEQAVFAMIVLPLDAHQSLPFFSHQYI